MSAQATLGLNTAPFKRGLEEARAQANAFGSSVKNSFASVGSGLIGALGVGVLVGQWRAMSEEFDRVAKLAARFGESAESVQRVAQAASLAGSDIELVARAMTLANQAAQKGSSAFDALGISAQAFAGMGLEDRLLALSQAYEQTSDKGKALAAITDLLGTRAADIVPLLAQGPDALRNAFAAANVVAEETIKQAERVNDQLTRLKNETIASLGPAFITVGGIVVQTVETLMKAWQLYVGSVTTGAVAIGEAFRGNFSLAKDLLKQIGQDAKDFAVQTGEGFNKIFDDQQPTKKSAGSIDVEGLAMTQAEIKKLADLEQRVAEARRKAAFEAYDNERKLFELMKERDALQSAAAQNDEAGLNAQLRLIEIAKEEQKIREDIAKEEERIVRLRESLAEKQRKMDFDRKDDRAKLDDLRQNIKSTEIAASGETNEEEKIRLQMRLLDLKKEEADLADEIAQKEKRRMEQAVKQATEEVEAEMRKQRDVSFGIGAVSSLARIGGGGGVEVAGRGDPALAMMKEQEKSRMVLERIEKILQEGATEAI
jgi:hypothetical protein